MGFDFHRKEMTEEPDSGTVLELMEILLEENLISERANIDSYRRIAASGKPDDEAALRLVRGDLKPPV